MFRSLMKYVQPGCLLFIREHVVENETQKVFIEFDHFIYETVYENKHANNWKQYSHYHSVQEWDEFLLSYGFKKFFIKKNKMIITKFSLLDIF